MWTTNIHPGRGQVFLFCLPLCILQIQGFQERCVSRVQQPKSKTKWSELHAIWSILGCWGALSSHKSPWQHMIHIFLKNLSLAGSQLPCNSDEGRLPCLPAHLDLLRRWRMTMAPLSSTSQLNWDCSRQNFRQTFTWRKHSSMGLLKVRSNFITFYELVLLIYLSLSLTCLKGRKRYLSFKEVTAMSWTLKQNLTCSKTAEYAKQIQPQNFYSICSNKMDLKLGLWK